jgi:hypothetical protein
MEIEVPDLGKIQSIHGLSPAYTQRVVIIAGCALLFFSAMLVAFAVRGWVGYALLAVGFFVVEILTFVGWYSQRGAELTISEKGFAYKDHVCRWEEIESIYTTGESGAFGKRLKCEIGKTDGEVIVVPDTIHGFEEIVKLIGRKIKTEN